MLSFVSLEPVSKEAEGLGQGREQPKQLEDNCHSVSLPFAKNTGLASCGPGKNISDPEIHSKYKRHSKVKMSVLLPQTVLEIK